MADVLKAGGYDVTLMTQAVGRIEGKEIFAPQANYIRDQFKLILNNPFLTVNDVVLVALTGHGVQYELVEGEKKTGKFYFCPADADVAQLKTANEITDRNQLLDLAELYAALDKCKAGGKLLFVDACRNDPTKLKIFKSVASETLPKLPPPPGGLAAFFSCSAHEEAIEDHDLKHGVFFHHIIEGLKGDADVGNAKRPADGEITLAELSEHAGRETYDFVRKKYPAYKQTPELCGEFRVSIPLLTLASKSPEPVKPLIPKPTVSTTGSAFAGKTAGEGKELIPGMKFHWCPPTSGAFSMGSPASEAGRSKDEDQVQVTLTSGFWLGETEVTQGQWEKLMKSTPWKGENYVREGADFAASNISHGDAGDGKVEVDSAVEFCRRLAEAERKANRLPTGWNYVIPTEAQWEYACRAGKKTKFSFGDDEGQLSAHAWWGGLIDDGNAKSEQFAHQVGKKTANPWGLSDMHGNVWEWCSDWYGAKLPGGRDPVGASTGSNRVNRGGGWSREASLCRSASRIGDSPGYRYYDLGFRVAGIPSAE